MNGVSHHFLTGAGGAGDQYRRVARRYQPRHAIDDMHAGGPAHYSWEPFNHGRNRGRAQGCGPRPFPMPHAVKQQVRPGAAPLRRQRRIAGIVQQQHVDSGEARMNDLQQLVRVQVGQPAVEQQQLAFAAFQFPQSIGSAQRFGGGNARQQQVLHNLFAKPRIGTGYNYRRIGRIEGLR